MKPPVIARLKPYLQTLEQGRTYYWCSCGLSKRQPYCDGSHRGTGREPIAYTPQVDEEVLFCGCKHSKDRPFCDGTHSNLPGGYQEDDPTSEANQKIGFTQRVQGARALLDGGCYVFRTHTAEMQTYGNVRYCAIITEALGAHYQSQFYLEMDTGCSAPIGFDERDVVLFVAEGEGAVLIGERRFEVSRTDGVYVRPGESFALQARAPLKVYVSVCPAAAELRWLERRSPTFDEAAPIRVVQVDQAKRHLMANRFFQTLVDRSVGSRFATQFIGHIPQSKAEPHRHLYEEALIILNGHGCLWTESVKAPVHAGDVVFLPRKQLHSLQALAREGMDVVGVIYPGDNPGINY